MVIQSLVGLYERLLAQGLVAPEGWDGAKISFVVVLRPDGSVKELRDVRESVKRGKKDILISKVMVLPRAVVRTLGKKSNFLWDNSAYVFGFNREKPEAAELCFRAMRRKHHLILDNCKGETAKAILSFFDTFSSGDIPSNPVFTSYASMLDGPYNYTFALDDGKGHELYAKDDTEIQEAWERYLEDISNTEGAVYGVCSVTGKEYQRLAAIHPKIKGVAGAESSGAALVCYNVKSVCSYGYDGEKSINAFISEYAATAYTKALNWLLSHSHHHMIMGNVTLVYWSERNEEIYGDCFEKILNGSGTASPATASASGEESADAKNGQQEQENTASLDEIMQAVKQGKGFPFDEGRINPDESFYILGLGSSGSRISVRFFMKNTFGNWLINMYKHQEQMLVERPNAISCVSLWMLLKNSVRAGADVPSPVVDTVFNSILHGTPYPAALFHNIVQRVFLDTDGVRGQSKTYKINYVKAGFIKAYLLRNCYERWKDLDSVSVNTDCNKKPYLLGRLFATLEGIQTSASPNISATIKDKFFNSACQTPAMIFPVLIKLSHAHMKKLRKPLAIYFGKIVEGMVDQISVNADGMGFPVRLNPEEQGAFILGYYQERKAAFKRMQERRNATSEKSERVAE